MADGPQPAARAGMPAQIGRYRILERVGRGAMGVVYAAHDDTMGRPVAVKVLMGDLESDPETRARFYREAQAAAGLLHPNIITIYDAGEDKGRSYIAMQLLEGWPLAVYLKQPDAAPLERKLDLMIQMCEGLAAAHGRGIVHRDLKPGNLFVQSDGLLKILDFGVARLADSSMTATGAMLGTPDYMSPEQARGTQVDTRSDIFSTGAVFYFMLAGHKPFPGPDLPAVLRQLQFEQPAALRDTEAPPELVRLVMQAMAKNPADRPPRVQDLLAGIVRFRRHYQTETRKLAAEAGARYVAVSAAEADLGKTADALGLSEHDDSSPVLRGLRERFPSLADRGAAAFEAPSFDRARVMQVRVELEEEHRRLDGELAARIRHLQQLEAGERQLEAGLAREALQLFDQVARERPSSRRAHELIARCGTAAREQEAREARVGRIMDDASDALEARDWARVVARCEEALALVPGLPAAMSMLAEAQRGEAREHRRKGLLVQQTLERAREAVDAGRFDEAESALREVEAIDPSSQTVGEMRDEIAQVQAAAAEADRVRRVTGDEIRRARAAFRRGRYDDAIDRLRGMAVGEAGAAMAAEANRLDGLRGRIARSDQERRRQVVALASAARAAAATGALDDALARAREAVRSDPSDLDASALLDELSERHLAVRLDQERSRAHAERARDVEPMIAAAREAQRRGYVSAALSVALAASRVSPDREEIAELIEELRRIAAGNDEEAFELTEEPFPAAAKAVAQQASPRPAPTPTKTPPPAGNGGFLAQWRRRRPGDQ
jgi:tetratricopeptide (TPR) repeat protein